MKICMNKKNHTHTHTQFYKTRALKSIIINRATMKNILKLQENFKVFKVEMAQIHVDRHREKQEGALQILFNVLLGGKKAFRPMLLKRNRKSQLQKYVCFHSSFNKAVLSAEFKLC